MSESFILHTHQQDAFNQLTDEQAGLLIKSIFAYQVTGTVPQFKESSLAIAFGFIKYSLDINQQKYAEICAKRAQAGRKGGKASKSKCLPSENKTTLSKAKHTNTKTKTNTDTKTKTENNINILTAQAGAAQGPGAALPEKKERQKTLLQQFSNQVLENFESAVTTDAQKGIWFKRNCRCLRDILNFCNQDIPLALQTIDVCIRRLEKAGMTGGYEAVCRNLPEYMVQAQQELEEQAHG